MASRRRITGAYSAQMKLPPIQRKYDNNENPMFQEFGDENFPSRFPRLPRIECSPSARSKAPLPFQGREGNQYLCLTIDEKRRRFREGAQNCESSFEKIDGFQELKREKATVRRERHRKDTRFRESNNSTMREMVKIAPITEKAFRRPVHFLRRRFKPGSAYRHGHGQMSHEELLAFDQNMDQLPVFTERDVKSTAVKDFDGKKMYPEKAGDSDITSYIGMFELEGRRNSFRAELSTKKETKVRVQGRFFEALDLHFYHYYRNTHPGRRMAICEEIERSIVVDDVALTCFREHLSLQEVMNTWIV